MSGNLSASILARLLTLAKQRGDDYSLLLNRFALERLLLRVYSVYTVIAEKYHAMVVLGQANSRMKDFYDLAVIARRTELDGATLDAAMAATFSRRQTPLPSEHPLALTSQFSEDPAKLKQWQAFLNKNRITAGSLAETVELLNLLLWPPTEVAAAQSQVTTTWRPASSQWAMSRRP